MLTATQRADIKRHIRNARQTMRQYDDPGLVRDCLADLMHYCEANGYDFDGELNSALRHYHAERNGED